MAAGLLVSVRSVAEAQEAVAGGAAIIDVKEPSRGPLGRADADVTAAIAEAVAGRAQLTVACGELVAGEPGDRVALLHRDAGHTRQDLGSQVHLHPVGQHARGEDAGPHLALGSRVDLHR